MQGARSDEEHDVVVVGAGPAGLSCAIECHDVRLDTIVVECASRSGGQLAEIPHSLRNVVGWHVPSGEPLLDALDESTAILGSRLRTSESVTTIDAATRRVEVEGTTLRARAIVIATGTRRGELPGVVEGALGGDVTYQVELRPGHWRGRDVVVVGGGDSATLDALELARDGSVVTLVHRAPSLTARDDIVDAVRSEPRIRDLAGFELDSLHGAARLEAVVLRDAEGRRETVACGGLVVKIARTPRTDLVRGQVDLDARGAVVVDDALRTSVEGVFAAGDVVAGAYPRVATALGQGLLAARSVLHHLEGRA